jgi:hypothetical protein
MAQGKLPDGSNERQSTPNRGPGSSRFIELVDSRRQHSLRYNHGILIRLQNWYNSYRGYWQGRTAQFRNNVTVPFTFAMIQSDVARKVQTTFGSWPIVTFEGYAPEDADSAKRNEVLISAQMKDCDSMARASDFLLQADLCGTAIARVGWKNITRKSKHTTRETVAPGLTIPVVHDGDRTWFDGPIWEPVDRLDFWQQPGKKRVEDMAWVIHRYWLDLDDMREDASHENPYFDPKAVRLIDQTPLQGFMHGEFVARRVMFRNEYDYMARQSEKFAKPVEIWEMHGEVPIEFAPDGVRHRCIAIANGRVVVRNKPSIRPGVLPFRSYSPMPDPYSFDGVGKSEIAYGMQQTVNRLANQKLDALDQLIDPMWIASNQSNLNTQHLFTRAGRILLVDGPADDTNIRPLVPNMQGLQAAYTELGQLWQFMQLGSGINDIVMGLQQNDRETARGFLGRQENVLTRLSYEARLLEEQFVEPIADDFRELDKLYLDMPHQVKILGSVASTNPITGLPYPSQPVTVDHEDLVPDYRARAVGASQMLSKSNKQQNMTGLLQMMSANPALVQLVNWANFARQMFEVFDLKNVDDLLVRQVPMINMMAQEGGVAPQQVAQQVQSPLSQLNPELLSSLMNHQPQHDLGSLMGTMSNAAQ